jgi:hypothetical protein
MRGIVFVLAILAATGASAHNTALEQGDIVRLNLGTNIGLVPAEVVSILSTPTCADLVHFRYVEGAIAGLSAGSACLVERGDE